MKVKVEYYPDKKETEKYHVMIKDSFISGWREVGAFKTADEADEFALSRGEKMIYEGIYNNGVRFHKAPVVLKKETPAPFDPGFSSSSDELEDVQVQRLSKKRNSLNLK